jgi:hypothetical protein
MFFVLQFELILEIRSIKCAYGGRQKTYHGRHGARGRRVGQGCCTLYRRATRHVLTRVAKCIEVDGAIFENVLY